MSYEMQFTNAVDEWLKLCSGGRKTIGDLHRQYLEHYKSIGDPGYCTFLGRKGFSKLLANAGHKAKKSGGRYWVTLQKDERFAPVTL